jgi:uncharacterized repeat protein (TIGR01451 family)/fimbrial isopeptide formation D2 family protein
MSFGQTAIAAVTVKSTTFTETTTGGQPLTYFYIDLAPTPILRGMYVSFEVQNDGVTRNDVWVKLNAPAYSPSADVSLAPNEDGLVNLGPMAAGAKKTAFIYLYSGTSLGQGQEKVFNPIQTYPVNVFEGRPDLSSAVNLGSTTLNIKQIQETIDASSNKVDTVVIDTDASTPGIDSGAPQLGGLVSINITTAATGNLSQADQLQFTPAAYTNWPADAFELIGTSITLTPGARGGTPQTFPNQIAFSFGSTSDYTTKYIFRVVGITSQAARISPIVNIKSGTNYKHTDTGSYAVLPAIPQSVSKLTLSKLVSQSQLTAGGTVTYTLRMKNEGTADAVIQDFCDTMPTGLASTAYQSGTSKFNGTSIANPVAPSATSDCPSATLLWAGSFTIPAGQSRDLTYQVAIPNTDGTYTNSAVAHINGVQIDTTLITTDNAPATVNVTVGTPPDLTLTKSDGGNSFAAGSTGTYNLTVSNSGIGATTGQITVTDSLPTGLSVPNGTLALSGTNAANWSCSASSNIIACTSNTAIAASGSSTFGFNVTVANNAPASVTNIAAVSGGNEPIANNGNNSGQDTTPITFTPDLTLSKTHTGNFTVGTPGTYALTVSNIGSAATTGTITMTDTLPPGLTIPNGAVTLTGTNAANWNCTASGNVITCTSTTIIAPTGSSTFNLTGIQVGSAAAPSVTNTASISGGGEANTSNDSASDVTTVVDVIPDVTLTKTHIGNLTVGTPASYSLTVNNIGIAPTTGTITISDTLPTGLTIPDGSITITGTDAPNWTCTASNNVITCISTTVIAANGNSTFNLTGIQVGATAVGSVTNTATVSGGGETNTANDSASDLATINGVSQPNVFLVKRITAINGTPLNVYKDDTDNTALHAADDNNVNWPTPLNTNTALGDTTISTFLRGAIDGGKVKPGDTIEYTIYFLNAGGSNANNVRVCDRIIDSQKILSGSPVLLQKNSATPTILTSSADTDRATFYPSSSDPAITKCNFTGTPTIDNGAIVVDVTGATGSPAWTTLPGSTGAGTTDTYGFVRFTTKVNP